MRKMPLIIIMGMLVAGAGAWLLSTGKMAEAVGDASFMLAPSGGTYTTGSTLTVTISETSSAGDNTNAVQVNLSFPAALLSWQSTNLTGPFTLCAQNSHGPGTVSLACAATAAQSGTQPVATVSFTVLAGGSAPVAFTSGSDIDNTSGASVWNGVLPSATYTLQAPAGSTTTTTKTATKTSSGAKATATPKPSASPSPTPSPSPSPSPTPAPAAGSISITVSDGSGRVSGATVDLDGRVGHTNDSGVVNFAGVTSGSHTLTITAAGHKSFTTTVDIGSGENALVSYKLTRDTGSKNWLWVVIAGLVVTGLAALTFWGVKTFLDRRQQPMTNLL